MNHSQSLAADPHTILGLERGCTKPQIKARYYELAKLTHPDSQPEGSDAETRGGPRT